MVTVLRTLLACTLVSSAPAVIGETAFSGTGYRPPPSGDIVGEWARERLEHDETHLLYDDGRYALALLQDPTDPYSPLLGLPIGDADASFATPALVSASHVFRRSQSSGGITRMLAWHLGFTKARPGYQVPYGPHYPPGSGRAAASLVKSGVSHVVIDRMSAMLGAERPAVSAVYAIALELLREKLAGMPVEGPETHALRPDVEDVLMAADSVDEVPDYAWYTLAKLVQSELSSWDGEAMSSYGYPQLPVALRMARAAAALHDAARHAHEAAPCDADNRGLPGTRLIGAPLCFVDATDRAVFIWFAAQLQRELDAHVDVHAGALTALAQVRRITPLWAGRAGRRALVAAPRAEVVEWAAAVRYGSAERLGGDSDEGPYADGIDEFSRRLADLVCEVEA